MKRLFKSIMIFCWFLSGIVSFDMFVLGGKLKLIWIAVANTSDYSPFSTDGQSNYILIGVFLIAGILAYVAFRIIKLFPIDEDDTDE